MKQWPTICPRYASTSLTTSKDTTTFLCSFALLALASLALITDHCFINHAQRSWMNHDEYTSRPSFIIFHTHPLVRLRSYCRTLKCHNLAPLEWKHGEMPCTYPTSHPIAVQGYRCHGLSCKHFISMCRRLRSLLQNPKTPSGDPFVFCG